MPLNKRLNIAPRNVRELVAAADGERVVFVERPSAHVVFRPTTDTSSWRIPCMRSALKVRPLLDALEYFVHVALRQRRGGVGGSGESDHRCHIVA